jgi:hypothetical protein
MVRSAKTKSQAGSSKLKAPVQLTGGSGFRYENPVAARFLLDMLTGKNVLGPDFGRVVRVDWQARDAGWLADDFAVTCRTASGGERAAGISAKDYQLLGRAGFPTEFARTAWQQWLSQNTTRTFRRGLDAIVLVTSDLAGDVRRAWSDLSTQAIATESSPERLVERLAEPDGAGAQSSVLQRVIFASLQCPDDLGAGQGDDLRERALLTRDVRVLKFDFETPQSSDQVIAVQDCQTALSSGDHAEAVSLWQRLVGIADELRPLGGSLDLPHLLDCLREQFSFREHPDFRTDWETLHRHSSEVMADIKSNIADAQAAHLPRDTQLADILELLRANRISILAGESGSGKSAMASQLATERYSRAAWLSADDLNHKNSSAFTRALGLRHSLPETLRASSDSSLVIFDSAESHSPDAQLLAGQLIREFLSNPGSQQVHVLITVQFEAADVLIRRLVQIGVPSAALNTKVLGRPSDAELDILLRAFSGLAWIVRRPEIKPLLLNLKVLDLTARTLGDAEALKDRPLIGLTTLIDILWEDWIQRGDDKYGRSHVLQKIGIHEADNLSSGIPLRLLDDSGDRKALPDLETSGLVRVKKERVTFTHDLLGDWARFRVLMGDGPPTAAASERRLQSPRWHKAIRLFGQHMLEQSADVPTDWRNCVENVPDDSIAGGLMRDLFLDSLFLATNASALLTRVWPVLIANKGALLSRLLDRFLFVATLPDARLLAFVPDADEAERISHAFRTPELIYFAPLLTVLHAHRDEVAQLAPYETARICALWLRNMPFELTAGVRMPWRQEAAELVLSIAREIQTRGLENSYFGSREDKVVYEALLYAALDLPAEVAQLSLELANRRPTSSVVSARVEATRQKRSAEQQQMSAKTKRAAAAAPVIYRSGRMREPWPHGPQSRVGHGFQEACLDTPAFTTLVQANPDVALEVLLAVCIEEPEEMSYGSSSLEDFGLAYWNSADPPAYFRGPFLPFIRFAREQGITFALKLVNFATQRVLGGKNIGISLEIDGQPKLWRGGANAFRWHHDGPTFHGALVQSVLMALEQWFYEQMDGGYDVTAAVGRIVSESESLAFAGVLFDLAKKDPSLLSGPLRPLFSASRLWHWDFQLTQLRYSGQSDLPGGAWFNQPQQLVALARQWHSLPHRREFLLIPNGILPRTMLSKPELRPFFEDVRKRWRAELDAEGEPEDLLLLIERITPENYTFPAEGDPNQEIVFQWPEAIARKNEEDLRQLNQNSAITQFPLRCMKVLAAGKPLPAEQLAPLLSWLKARDSDPPLEPEDEEQRPFPIENTILGGIAVLVAFHLDWLREDPSRIEWCQAKLEAIADNPPETPNFDSEVAISGFAWDDFAAVTGVRLLAADPKHALARRLVAQAITGFHYRTTESAMSLAFQLRDPLGADFDRLITLSVHWAALRMLGARGPEATEADKEEWEGKKTALVAAFINGSLSTELPDLKLIDAETVRAYEERRQRAWPEYGQHARRGSGDRREELYPEMPGFDERVLTGALSWLNPEAAQSPQERARCLALMQALLQLTFDRIPRVDDAEKAEIKGLPSGYDDWIFSIVARAIPHLKSDENPGRFWKAILNLGAPAHEWVERFFWHWFTDGLRASGSAAEFVRLWQGMVLYALSSPKWDPQQRYSRYDVEAMVIELLGLDSRWNAFASDESFTVPLKSMMALFEQAAQRWFTPRIVRNFLHFVVKPAAAPLLLPALPWLATALASFDSYDWREDIEGGLIEYLHVGWRREGQNILADPKLNKAYLDLLANVVSRGSHAAIALRDRVAAGATT